MLGGDGSVHYLDCGNDFVVVCICQNLCVFCMSIILQKLLKIYIFRKVQVKSLFLSKILFVKKANLKHFLF